MLDVFSLTPHQNLSLFFPIAMALLRRPKIPCYSEKKVDKA